MLKHPSRSEHSDAAGERASGTWNGMKLKGVQPMNWDQVEGNWKQLKGKARQKWGQLTDDELDRVSGRREELVGLIQERYGKARDQAEREVNEWRDRLDDDRTTTERSTSDRSSGRSTGR
jgi:uncharacterized protein YjbJ (UPF0337 family)